MAFVFTFLLIATLEAASGKDAIDEPKKVEEVEDKDPDMCVGCDKNKEEQEKQEDSPPLTVEVRIDPTTGKVQYIIRGIELQE